MRIYTGSVREVRIDEQGRKAVRVNCSQQATPQPGRYVMVRSLEEPDAVLSSPLFASKFHGDGFTSAPGAPTSWEPGVELEFRVTQGRGFSVPETSRHLVLAALSEGIERLLPLIEQALKTDSAVALFTDCAFLTLPTAVEVHPLNALPGAIEWADALCCDLPIDSLPDLRQALGMGAGDRLPYHAEVLVESAMPCGGLAECAVCAVPSSTKRARRKWKYTCRDGPVFDLNELDW